jgi:uncharacterized damage-inducible protein DinB
MTYYGNTELAASARTVRKNTIAVAEDIPEDKYDFRPSPDSRSVAELLRHIAVSTQGSYHLHAVAKTTSFVGFDWAVYMEKVQHEEARLQTKAQILEALRSGGEAWASYLDTVPESEWSVGVIFAEDYPPKTRFEMYLSVKEHEMHHRAQLMVLERMLGIVPHLTRQMQERWAAAAAPKATSAGA